MLSKLLAGDLKEVWITGLLLTPGDQPGVKKDTLELNKDKQPLDLNNKELLEKP